MPVLKKSISEVMMCKTMYGITKSMGRLRLGDSFKSIVKKTCELFGTDMAYIAMPGHEKNELYNHTTFGIHTDTFKKMRIPLGNGVGGLVVKTNKGYIIDDYFTDNRLENPPYAIIANEGIISLMAAPIKFSNKHIGVLYVANRTYLIFLKQTLKI
jgi:GAF domain-containing protein